jgi:hypothetical protein
VSERATSETVGRGFDGRFTTGNRGRVSVSKRVQRRFAELATGFEQPLEPFVSAMVLQVARLLIKAEMTKDASVMVRASTAAFRMLASLQKQRRGTASSAPLRDRLTDGGKPTSIEVRGEVLTEGKDGVLKIEQSEGRRTVHFEGDVKAACAPVSSATLDNEEGR